MNYVVEQVMMSNELFLKDGENTHRSVFEETGIHSPIVYFRLARIVIRHYLMSVKSFILFATVALALLLMSGSKTVPSHPSSTLVSDTTIDDSQCYDLSEDDY